MPCNVVEHSHQWVRVGVLVIERCERYCQFCFEKDGSTHEYKSGWFLRRHIRDCHGGQYPNLTVSEGWTGKPEGNAKKEPSAPRIQKIKSERVKKTTKSTRSVPVAAIAQHITPLPPAMQIAASHFDFSPQGAYTADDMMFAPAAFGSSEFVDSSDTSFLDLFWGPTSTLPTAAATATTDLAASNPTLLQDFINPSMLNDAPYASVSPWSTPQSVRTNNQTIEAVMPTAPMDGTPDRLVRRLNEAFRDAIEKGAMTDAKVLGTLTAYTDAFKHGRAF